jgi:hypothetical protein
MNVAFAIQMVICLGKGFLADAKNPGKLANE